MTIGQFNVDEEGKWMLDDDGRWKIRPTVECGPCSCDVPTGNGTGCCPCDKDPTLSLCATGQIIVHVEERRALHGFVRAYCCNVGGDPNFEVDAPCGLDCTLPSMVGECAKTAYVAYSEIINHTFTCEYVECLPDGVGARYRSPFVNVQIGPDIRCPLIPSEYPSYCPAPSTMLVRCEVIYACFGQYSINFTGYSPQGFDTILSVDPCTGGTAVFSEQTCTQNVSAGCELPDSFIEDVFSGCASCPNTICQDIGHSTSIERYLSATGSGMFC